LLEETGHSSVDDLFMEITTGRTEDEKPKYPEYKDHAPLLFRAIDQNDSVAYNYLDWLCRDLIRYVVIGVNELSIGNRELTVVLSGGVPKGGDIMRERLCHHLNQILPNAKLISAKLEPVAGAMLLGYDKIYPQGIPSGINDVFERNCMKYKLFRYENV